MYAKHIRTRLHRLYWGLFATIAALCLVLTAAQNAFANTVNISDRAVILDVARVRNEASWLPYRIDISTTSDFKGSKSAFDQEVRRSIPNANSIVMAISANLQYVAIAGGNGVKLSNSQYADAMKAFLSSYKSSRDFTSATIAAIRSLRDATGTGSGVGSFVAGGGFGTATNIFFCFGLLALLGLAFFVFQLRQTAGGFFKPVPWGYGSSYNQAHDADKDLLRRYREPRK